MKKTVLILIGFIMLFSSLGAQYNSMITVPAGTRIIEKFPPSVRYLYPQFTEGKVINAAGAENSIALNYNLLTKEMQFLQGNDTLAIVKKKDVNMVVIEQDTFIYRNEYLKRIHGGNLVVLESDAINFMEAVKIGAMGQPVRSSSVGDYNNIPYMTNLYFVTPNANLLFKRELHFYILASHGRLVEVRKKNVLELYPENKPEIQRFLKENKLKYDNREDILKLANFLVKIEEGAWWQ